MTTSFIFGRARRAGGGAPTRVAPALLAAALLGGLGAVGVVASGGCAARNAPRTTRLQAADMQVAADRIRDELALSPWLAQRGPESARLALEPWPAENRSTERLSRVDRWGIVTRVAFDPGVQALLRDKNVDLLTAREETAAQLRRWGMGDLPVEPVTPTHQLRAEVESLARRAGDAAGGLRDPAAGRTDTYMIRYAIVEVASGRVEWTGTYEFKRVAYGTVAD